MVKKSEFTCRPDCPCDFCVRVRAEIAEGRTEKNEQNRLAEEFIRSLGNPPARDAGTHLGLMVSYLTQGCGDFA